MKEKVIKSVLAKKFKEFLDSIEDENLKKMIRENTIITGGSICSLMQNEPPNDFDLYFRNRETVLAVAKYYVNRFNAKHPDERPAAVISSETVKVSTDYDGKHTYTIQDLRVMELVGMNTQSFMTDNIEKYPFLIREAVLNPNRVKVYIKSSGIMKDDNYYDDKDPDLVAAESVMNPAPVEEIYEVLDESEMPDGKKKYEPVFITANAISLSGKIQIILRFYGEPADIHDTYDFVHCMGYWTSWNNELTISKDVYEAVMNRNLVYRGSKYPVCSMFRLRKFIKRGWNINAGQLLKIAFQISQLDLTDINVLEDQLIGVDSAYFTTLIEQLRKQQEERADWKFSEPYLMSIIDKIF